MCWARRGCKRKVARFDKCNRASISWCVQWCVEVRGVGSVSGLECAVGVLLRCGWCACAVRSRVVFEGGVRRRCPGAVPGGGYVGGRCQKCSSFCGDLFIIFLVLSSRNFRSHQVTGRSHQFGVLPSRILESGGKTSKTLENHHSLFFFAFSTFSDSFFHPFFIGLIT